MKLCFLVLHVSWISTPVEAPVHGNICICLWSISGTQVCKEELKLQERPAVVTCDHCKGNVTATELVVDYILFLVP